ncbi:MAG TPA: type III pantothenate kinase [Wenzhouxiangella sp.]|nr:type III pantothenate kinase [Wenzhouxiangella sp.]
MPVDVLIDIGHSRLKWGRLVAGTLDPASIGRASTDEPGVLLSALEQGGCSGAIVSGQSRVESVRQISEGLRQMGARVDIMATGDREMPVAPAYKSLGCDRWLALQKPWCELHAPFVVVDCGTAITVDLVDGKGHHRGGWIMPGVHAARGGLFARTPGLNRPLPEPGIIDRPARGTGSALVRGGLLQAIGGIDRAVRAAEQAAEDHVSLWLTGGNAAELAAHLERPARQEQHLVLHGLAMATHAK